MSAPHLQSFIISVWCLSIHSDGLRAGLTYLHWKLHSSSKRIYTACKSCISRNIYLLHSFSIGKVIYMMADIAIYQYF